MMISDQDIAEMRKRALACDDEQRIKRGKFPRRTRCLQCATILTLLADIEINKRSLLEQRMNSIVRLPMEPRCK